MPPIRETQTTAPPGQPSSPRPWFDLDDALGLLRRIATELETAATREDRIALAMADLGADDRRLLGTRYPRLFGALLDAEHSARTRHGLTGGGS